MPIDVYNGEISQRPEQSDSFRLKVQMKHSESQQIWETTVSKIRAKINSKTSLIERQSSASSKESS